VRAIKIGAKAEMVGMQEYLIGAWVDLNGERPKKKLEADAECEMRNAEV